MRSLLCTDQSASTADLNCVLAGTTAATCTGYTSYGSGFDEGSVTGPTQTSWTTTLTGSEVAWGILTLATPGSDPLTTDIEGTVVGSPTMHWTRSGGLPTATAKPTSAGYRTRGTWAAAGLTGATMLLFLAV